MSSERGDVSIATLLLALVVIFVIATFVLAVFLFIRDDGDGDLTIYSSLPLHGADGPDRQVEDMVRAIDLALEQRGHKAGSFTVKHVSLDDSTPDPGGFTAAATASNARTAADDDHTGGYLGDFSSGASAISIPILSVAKVPQVSPASTAVGLTSEGDQRGSADPSEPETYYSEGYRNFVRVVPKDSVQADAITGLLLDDGCQRVAMINDGGYYGVRLAREIRLSSTRRGLKIVFDKTIGTRASRLPRLAAAKEPDCFIYSGARDDRTVDLFTGVARRRPRARLYGGDGLAETAFTTQIDQATADRVHMTLPARDREARLGRAFVTSYKQRFAGDEPEPYAVYAYESALLLLDAIERSETGKREDIVRELFETDARASAIGTYSIDDNGDTDATRYDLYRIANRGLRFDRTIDAR